MRKWIVRNFALGTFVTLFGKTVHTLRAPRILYPLYVLTGLIISFDPLYPMFQWYDFALLGLIAIGLWIGFPLFKWTYFKLYPLKYDELDDMQKYDWIRAHISGSLTTQTYTYTTDNDGKIHLVPIIELTKEQLNFFDEYEETVMKEKYYNGKFAGLENLIPLIGSILIAIIWYNLVF